MNTALILIDIQNDYFPGGAMELVGSPAAGQQAQLLLAGFRQAGWPVVHVQHLSTRPGAAFFLPNTPGADIHPLVTPLAHETVVQKHYPNSFRETPLLDWLTGQRIERLVIAGMMTHMCVDATTRAAYDYGFACWLAHDACATRNLVFQEQTVPAAAVHAAFLAALKAVYAQVSSTAEILEALPIA